MYFWKYLTPVFSVSPCPLGNNPLRVAYEDFFFFTLAVSCSEISLWKIPAIDLVYACVQYIINNSNFKIKLSFLNTTDLLQVSVSNNI